MKYKGRLQLKDVFSKYLQKELNFRNDYNSLRNLLKSHWKREEY